MAKLSNPQSSPPLNNHINNRRGESETLPSQTPAQATTGKTPPPLQTEMPPSEPTETALRASEARFMAFFENATEPIVVVDNNGQVVLFNRSAEKKFGYAREEVIGQPLSRLIPQRFQDIHIQHIQKYLADPHPRPMGVGLTLFARRKDGQEFPAEISLSYNEITQETVAFVVDITERIQFQQEQDKRLKQLTTLRTVDAALAERLDVDYVLRIASESVAQLSGAEAGFIVWLDDDGAIRLADAWGDYLKQPIGADYQTKGQGVVGRVLRSRSAEWIADVRTDPDYVPTRPQTVSQITVPLYSQEKLIGVLNLETAQPGLFNADAFTLVTLIASRIGAAIDNARLYQKTSQQLAELQQLYEKVHQLEQLKTDMIRIAAHDLRNPLASIMGNTELIRMDFADNEIWSLLQSSVKNIEDSITRMRNIINDILSLERIEQLAEEVVLVAFDLRDLVRAVYQETLADARIEARQITLVMPDNPVTVIGDAAQLQEALANLVSNAVKYTRSAGRIDIRLQLADQIVIFEVEDNGYGIRPEQQTRLFQPFYRARTSETADIEGTGLGLHLVKNIIERHNGAMQFQSVHGQGSTFGFTLPLATQ